MLLFALFLSLISVAAAFGVTYLLLRKTPYTTYTLLLSVISFQPIEILALTLLGYRIPVPLRTIHVFIPVIAGTCVTVLVLWRYWSEIAANFIKSWKQTVVIYVLAMFSMVIASPVFIGGQLAYIDYINGEYVNYSYYAECFLGVLRDPNYLPGFLGALQLRYGAELFLAALSALTGTPPLLVIEVLSGLHKTGAIIAFAIGCEFLRRQHGISVWAYAAACVGFAFSTILALNHMLAFFAAQAATPSFVLLGLGLLSTEIRSRRIQAFFAVHVLFILITYAEHLPFLCGVAGLVCAEALLLRRKAIALSVAVAVGAGLAVNPLLVMTRLKWLVGITHVIAGFNVLGSPKDSLPGYVANILGLTYRLVDMPRLSYSLLAIMVPLSLLAVAAALLVATVRLRSALFLLVPLTILLSHFHFFGQAQPEGSAYYKSYKMIAALHFYGFFALMVLLDTIWRHRRWNRGAVSMNFVVLAATGAYFAGNAYISVSAAARIKQVDSVYWKRDFESVLAQAHSEPVLVLTRSVVSSSFWDLMVSHLGARRVILDSIQAEMVYHSFNLGRTEPVILDGNAGSSPRSRVAFSGNIVVPLVLAYSPSAQAVNVRQLLQSISPRLELRQNKVLLATPAFRLVQGTLAIAGETAAPPSNHAPLVVDVTPASGRGLSNTFRFAYEDQDGSPDLMVAIILVNDHLNGSHGCYLSYTRRSNQLGLAYDGADGWKVIDANSGVDLDNSQCVLEGHGSSISTSDNRLTVSLALRFKPAFAGAKQIHTYVVDEGGLSSGWRLVGTWTVP